MRGYAAVGLYMPKNELNVGGAMRAVQCFGASLVVVSGRRYWSMSTDTMKAHRHIPVLHTQSDLLESAPLDCVPVAIELVEESIPLPNFAHPERAFYVFGPEDGSIPKDVVDRCKFKVSIPMAGQHLCMNLASTVNVVLYDRMVKRTKSERMAA